MKKYMLSIIVVAFFINFIILSQNRDEKIKDIYIEPTTYQDVYKSKLIFTDKELDWIEENKERPIIVGAAKDYTPVEYVNGKGNPKGIGIEVLREVSEITGLSFKLYENVMNEKWAELLESFKDKKIDILPAVSYTEERSKYMKFSSSYIDTTLVILSYKSNFEVIPGLDAVNNGTFVIPKGYWIKDIIEKQKPNINIILVDNMEQVLKYVNNKKADYAVCEIPIFTYYKDQGLYSNLRIVGEIDEKNQIRIAVQKDSECLISIIDKVIQQIDDDELYEKALVLPKTNKKEKRLVLTIMILVIVLSVVIYYLYKSISELVIAKKRAETANNEKIRLMTNISHDLRTPITVILGYADAIVDEEVKEKKDIERYIKRIKKKTQYLNTLINDFFLLARLEDNQLTFKKQEVNINDFIENILDNMEIKFLAKDINIKINLDKNINFKKEIDPDRMYQALQNIINNAIKFVEYGGEIIVGTKLGEDNKVKIYVQDDGCGILEKDISHIFERYYKVVHKEQKEESTGLGLCIAKEIIEKHEGQIWVESEPNEGSKFYIVL